MEYWPAFVQKSPKCRYRYHLWSIWVAIPWNVAAMILEIDDDDDDDDDSTTNQILPQCVRWSSLSCQSLGRVSYFVALYHWNGVDTSHRCYCCLAVAFKSEPTPRDMVLLLVQRRAVLTYLLVKGVCSTKWQDMPPLTLQQPAWTCCFSILFLVLIIISIIMHRII